MSEEMAADVAALLLGAEYDEVRRRSYIALDVPTRAEALRIVDELGDVVDGYKVGLQLFHAVGQPLLDELVARGKRIFLDVKLHDIPNTVAGAIAAICQRPIEMVNVHALGGLRMLEAARAARDAAPCQPLLIGVTALTSMDATALAEVGLATSAEDVVTRLANLSRAAGLDGVVASGRELCAIYQAAPPTFETVVPGTRLAGTDAHDQARTLTPAAAMAAGATRLVLGRAVLRAPDPLAALRTIWRDMLNGLAAKAAE